MGERKQCVCGRWVQNPNSKSHLDTNVHKVFEASQSVGANPEEMRKDSQAIALRAVLGNRVALVPSRQQGQNLENSPFANYHQLTYYDWFYEMFDFKFSRQNPNEAAKPLALTSVTGKFEEGMHRDQFLRAWEISEYMIRHGKHKLVTMDGHGRFPFALAYCLWRQGRDVNAYSVQLYDLDENAHRWHAAFIPSDANHPHQRDNIFRHQHDDDTLVYLNFCALKQQYAALLAFLIAQRHTVFVSFSIRGSDVKVNGQRLEPKTVGLHRGMSGMVDRLNALYAPIVIAHRKPNFVTLRINL